MIISKSFGMYFTHPVNWMNIKKDFALFMLTSQLHTHPPSEGI